MPQIAHTKSIAFTHTCLNGEANLEITNARNYTKFIIDAVHTNVTGLTIQVNLGSGWRNLYTTETGAAAQVTLNASGVNIVDIGAPAKGGVRLGITDNDAGTSVEVTVTVTMTGSLYSEGRK